MNNKYVPFLFIIGIACMLLFPAFYNGYALVYSDTGAYIFSGFESVVPRDRPITYGLFIRHSSLASSIWFTLIAQALIVSYTLYALTRFLVEEKPLKYKLFAISAFILTVFSSLAWYTSFIMADIFTPVSFILLLLILVRRDFSITSVVLYVVCWLFLSSTHLSNLLSSVLFLLSLLVLRIACKQTMQWLSARRIVMMLALAIANFFLLASLHYAMGGGFKTSRTSNIFFTGKLIENGVLKAYLDKECAGHAYKFCTYKDSLPYSCPEFLWMPNSPLQKMGGWDADHTEFSEIIRNILTTPKYLLLFINESIVSMCKQISCNDFGEEFIRFEVNSPPYLSVNNYFTSELNQFTHSAQNAYGYEMKWFKDLSKTNNMLTMLSVFLLIYVCVFSNISLNMKAVTLMSLLYYVCNASAAAINTLSARYSSRFSWIFIFLAIIALARMIAFLQKQREIKTHPPGYLPPAQ